MDLAARLKKEGFSISAKSTVVASSQALAKAVVKELANQGLTLAVAEAGRDLGCDFAAGARRRIILQAARRTKVSAEFVGVACEVGELVAKGVLSMIQSMAINRSRSFNLCLPRFPRVPSPLAPLLPGEV